MTFDEFRKRIEDSAREILGPRVTTVEYHGSKAVRVDLPGFFGEVYYGGDDTECRARADAIVEVMRNGMRESLDSVSARMLMQHKLLRDDPMTAAMRATYEEKIKS